MSLPALLALGLAGWLLSVVLLCRLTARRRASRHH